HAPAHAAARPHLRVRAGRHPAGRGPDGGLLPPKPASAGGPGQRRATGLAGAGLVCGRDAPAAAGRAGAPTVTSSRLRSTVFRPMPLTRASSSTLLNGPLALRWATMASALAGPMPTSAASSCAASAVLMLT